MEPANLLLGYGIEFVAPRENAFIDVLQSAFSSSDISQ